MPCEWYSMPGGGIMHVNAGRRGGRRKVCPFCKRNEVEKLCDFPVGLGLVKTCDAEMCRYCATTKGRQHTDVGHGMKRLNDTFDLCPNHCDEPIPAAPKGIEV